jgi:hypothetical protein
MDAYAYTPVADLSHEDLDYHMEKVHHREVHRRESGEPGYGSLDPAIRTHEQLHRGGVWKGRPHTHGTTLPCGA